MPRAARPLALLVPKAELLITRIHISMQPQCSSANLPEGRRRYRSLGVLFFHRVLLDSFVVNRTSSPTLLLFPDNASLQVDSRRSVTIRIAPLHLQERFFRPLLRFYPTSWSSSLSRHPVPSLILASCPSYRVRACLFVTTWLDHECPEA